MNHKPKFKNITHENTIWTGNRRKYIRSKAKFNPRTWQYNSNKYNQPFNHDLITILTNQVNKVLTVGIFPNAIKVSRVGPISVTNVFKKIVEKIRMIVC